MEIYFTIVVLDYMTRINISWSRNFWNLIFDMESCDSTDESLWIFIWESVVDFSFDLCQVDIFVKKANAFCWDQLFLKATDIYIFNNNLKILINSINLNIVLFKKY